MIVFTACNDDKKEKSNATDATEKTTETPRSTKSAESTDNNNDGAVALNPAHGEPGHRCDIPVGAPLDSPSRTQTQTQTQTQNNTSPVIKKSTSDNATGEIKKNPPHGQPGHRCDIPVGADLDS